MLFGVKRVQAKNCYNLQIFDWLSKGKIYRFLSKKSVYGTGLVNIKFFDKALNAFNESDTQKILSFYTRKFK